MKLLKMGNYGQAVVVYAFSSSSQKQKWADLYEFEASLVYRASSRIARATHRETLSRKIKKENLYSALKMREEEE